jgi:hypothetical protein
MIPRYRQVGQSWSSATIINLALAGLLLAIALLYVVVKLWELVKWLSSARYAKAFKAR